MRRILAIAASALILAALTARAEGDIAGTYVGEYVNKAGKSGGYQLTFTPGAGGSWTGEVVAVLDGQPTKSTMTALVVKGDSIEAAYDFEVKGNKASSRIKGTKTGPALTGTFETLYKGKVVDTGTWKTSLKRK
ncbi:MAG TPA: hypothetical protein VMN82_12215 [Thermoanaerobaculia bacterium]|nr:hypothetical protein [Thermoanaerobaculia bacterium]